MPYDNSKAGALAVSLILEALSRSQQDRQSETGSGTPGLDTPAYVDVLSENRSWLSYLPWLALLGALLIIGFLVVDRSGGVKPPATTAIPVKPESEMPMAGEVVSPVPQAEPKTGARVLTMQASEPTPPVVEEAASDPEVAALYSSGDTDGGVTEQAIDIEEVLVNTEEALRASRLQEHSAPFLADLSQQRKDDIPSIMYRHHDYSSDAAQSSVVLNGKKVRVGERLAGGIRLDEILPDSIVLSHKGQQFRLRALNSWVNL